jgi:drug/metabolite transporter (DMT)-like permease
MNTTAIILGLISAILYGARDFSGGLATRRANVFGVVVVSQCFGLLTALIAVLSIGDPLPSSTDLRWGVLAGLCGVIGLIAFYRALAVGQMGVATPVTAVFAAGLPVSVAALSQRLQVVGFGLGLLGVRLLARTERGEKHNSRRSGLGLAVIAGLCLGGFLVLIHQASGASTYWPLIAARVASISVVSIFATFTQERWLPTRQTLPLIVAAGTLDMAGNFFFVWAGQIGRLDVAGVLSSLYPAVTVVLAMALLREPVTRTRLVGIGAALLAIVLIVNS